MAVKATAQATFIDVTDAYSVGLTSEVYNWTGGQSGIGSGATCVTEVYGWQGSNRVQVVNVTAADIVCPTGISATVENNGTSQVKITFRTTQTISTTCEATIPIVLDGDVTMNKKFTFSVSKQGPTGAKGDTGVSVTNVQNKYLASSSNSGVTTSTSGWTEAMQTTDTTKKYLWSYQVISYSNKTTSNTVPTIIGTHGATGSTGAQGVSVTNVQNKYLASSSNSGVTTSTSGWTEAMQTTDTTKKYLWSYQVISYSNKTTSNTVPTIIGTHGATGAKGDPGDDAITLTYTTSNGTVFKNSSGTSVCTAHVFQGGVEKSITDAGVVAGGLGTIKWYKAGSETAIATAKSITVTANDVTNTLAYTCQLED